MIINFMIKGYAQNEKNELFTNIENSFFLF